MHIEVPVPVGAEGLTTGSVVRVYGSLQAARSRWEEAVEGCAAYGFQTYAWASTWQDTIGQAEGVKPLVVELTDFSERTLMLWPLAIHREGHLRVLRFLGGVVTDYNAPIVDTAFAEKLNAVALQAIWHTVLKALPKIDLVWLRRMPETIEGVRNPMILLSGATHTENAYAAHLPTSMGAFQENRSAKIFADARRQLRRLGEVGAVRITEHADAEEAAKLTRIMARQKSRRWHESQGRDLFAEPGYLDFYERLGTQPEHAEFVAVSAMTVGDTVVATHWGLIFRGRYYWLMPGYEVGEWGRYSCGRLLMQHMIETSIAQGLKVFDLTVGDEDYKKSWADHTLPLYETVSARSALGRLRVNQLRLRQWARAQPWIHQAVRTLRQKLKR